MPCTNMSSKIFESPRSSQPFSAALLDRLRRLHPKSIDLSLERVERLLDALGRPEQRLPPVVHVAGTNGKGSVVAFLRSVAEALGKRAHVYTSPHLVDFHERIVIGDMHGGAPISEDLLVDCLIRTEVANDGQQITLFEITTVAALLAFAESPADIVLLETGLGGRLDATNVVANPAATVITSISLDHIAFLGDTVQAIAAEKAGILKPGTPCVVARQNENVLPVIEARAREIGAPLIVSDRDFTAYEQRGRLIFENGQTQLILPLPSLKGRHQIYNAAAAVAAAQVVFDAELSNRALGEGLATAQWPARMERLGYGSLHNYVDDATEIWLDGGHNPAGAEVVADAIKDLNWQRSGPVHLIWGMMEGKDAHAVIGAFRGLVDHVYTVPVPDEPGAFEPEALAEIARASGFAATVGYGLRHALLLSNASARRPANVLICGSLYLAGHVLKLHHDRDDVRGASGVHPLAAHR
ncbi:MAG TPA: folylpolyglutamate synthase/dihydrofolate synthase family protein [Hyphomicrobium sp.]|nr:folylpolyglutamate synthase/dihydrofolate synthase family protein [Hyphomicrobium sp.]